MGTSVQDMSASSDLLWALTKKQNAFLVKRNMLQLSSEPGNIMNKNSFKFSGLANLETVDVADNTKGITFSRKTRRTQRTLRGMLSQLTSRRTSAKLRSRLRTRLRAPTTVRTSRGQHSLGGTRSGRARTRVPSARIKCM